MHAENQKRTSPGWIWQTGSRKYKKYTAALKVFADSKPTAQF
jgi:hypothetical protein